MPPRKRNVPTSAPVVNKEPRIGYFLFRVFQIFTAVTLILMFPVIFMKMIFPVLAFSCYYFYLYILTIVDGIVMVILFLTTNPIGFVHLIVIAYVYFMRVA